MFLPKVQQLWESQRLRTLLVGVIVWLMPAKHNRNIWVISSAVISGAVDFLVDRGIFQTEECKYRLLQNVIKVS